jgi:hypothetical protein
MVKSGLKVKLQVVDCRFARRLTTCCVCASDIPPATRNRNPSILSHGLCHCSTSR